MTKLTDSQIDLLFDDTVQSCTGFDEYYEKSRQAIRQLMEDRDRYREALRDIMVLEGELNLDNYGYDEVSHY